jgi:hypothetical protein
MGRGALFVLAAVWAAFWVCAALAQAQTVGEDSAVGDVISDIQRPLEIVFDAHSGLSGENPSGSVAWSDRSVFMGGPVTCLTVTSNRATIGFENQHDGSPTLNGGFLFVEDNGMPGAGQDNIRAILVPGAAPTVCPPNTEVYNESNTVASGELTVHDAPAFPTSKDQCKHGGWQSYGVFKNQGDCVRFVRHQARQECTFIRAANGRPAFRAEYGSGVHKRHAMRRCIRERMND